MPIIDNKTHNTPFTKKLDPDQKRKLAIIINEMEQRGLQVPDEYRPKEINWGMDAQGYFIKQNGTLYNPTEEQGGFVKSPARLVGFFGARGSGKSAAGAQKAVKKIQQGYNGAILNPDFENFKISTWPEFRRWLPWDSVIPAHRRRRNPEWQPSVPFVMAFLNGVQVICKGVKDADSARGPNINWLWYDEGTRDKEGESWQVAVASVRVGYAPQCWITATPRGKRHWTYPLFIQKKIPQDAQDIFEEEGLDRPLVESFYGTILDNKENLDPGFMAAMLATYPEGWLRQQEIFGKFVDEGGKLGDRGWFNDKILTKRPDNIHSRIRYWDLAATEKKIIKTVRGQRKNDPDETVGTLMSWNKEHFFIEDQTSGFWEWQDIKENIKMTAIYDGPAVKVMAEEEPGSGGKNQIAELNNWLKKELPGHPGLTGYRPEGDRVQLANIWFAEADKQGIIYLVAGNWIEGFFDQLDDFPEGHDDKVTSVSGARINIAPIKKWASPSFLSL